MWDLHAFRWSCFIIILCLFAKLLHLMSDDTLNWTLANVMWKQAERVKVIKVLSFICLSLWKQSQKDRSSAYHISVAISKTWLLYDKKLLMHATIVWNGPKSLPCYSAYFVLHVLPRFFPWWIPSVALSCLFFKFGNNIRIVIE